MALQLTMMSAQMLKQSIANFRIRKMGGVRSGVVCSGSCGHNQ
jgi:hypothetical protein